MDLTLSDLLEAFDGVLKMKGRMMVITTNHLNKLDPALTRPGRVDTILEFKRSTREAIRDIFGKFYTKETLANVDIEEVKEGVWTPAEVVQICVNNPFDVKTAWKTVSARKHFTKPKTEKYEFCFYS